MISSVLIVCVGNVCRSPIGERLLARDCPDIRVESAGLGALEGHSIDKDAAEVAKPAGVNVENHSARQFSSELASKFDLVLVMERNHLKAIAAQAPHLSGKAMLYGHWIDGADISDPYRKSQEFHQAVFNKLEAACAGWAKKLAGKKHD